MTNQPDLDRYTDEELGKAIRVAQAAGLLTSARASGEPGKPRRRRSVLRGIRRVARLATATAIGRTIGARVSGITPAWCKRHRILTVGVLVIVLCGLVGGVLSALPAPKPRVHVVQQVIGAGPGLVDVDRPALHPSATPDATDTTPVTTPTTPITIPAGATATKIGKLLGCVDPENSQTEQCYSAHPINVAAVDDAAATGLTSEVYATWGSAAQSIRIEGYSSVVAAQNAVAAVAAADKRAWDNPNTEDYGITGQWVIQRGEVVIWSADVQTQAQSDRAQNSLTQIAYLTQSPAPTMLGHLAYTTAS